jgi:hypothetical protein
MTRAATALTEAMNKWHTQAGARCHGAGMVQGSALLRNKGYSASDIAETEQ